MAKPQPPLQPVIMEHQHEGNDDGDGDVAAVSGGCFRLFCCFDNHHHHYDGESAGFLHHQSTSGGGDLIDQNTWLMRRAKSLKEFSEVVAGPKWKNFIRRFSKRPKTTARSSGNTPFQYDPQSYALNFNDHEDDDLLPRSFSTRYAPPSRSTTTQL